MTRTEIDLALRSTFYNALGDFILYLIPNLNPLSLLLM
jgi:hypothetical protein